jgi:predicted Zn finger-like uncharacterized protein
MIIVCPACSTRYAVPDAAIGSEGRTVRCAKCKHSWFQEPLVLELGSEPAPAPITPAPTPAAPEAEAPPLAPAPSAEPEPGPQPVPSPEPEDNTPSVSHWRAPEPEPTPDAGFAPEEGSLAFSALRRGLRQQQTPAAEEPEAPAPATPAFVDDTPEPPFDDEDEAEGGSQFDYRAPFTRRRNTLRMWTIAAALFALIATGMVVAVNFYGLPEWVPISRPTFGAKQPELEFDFPKAQQRKEPLESGETIFRVRGTITNNARETMSVPQVLVVFKDVKDRKIGDYLVAPPKRSLAPGETVTVTEAIRNIPPNASEAALGWAPI